MKTHNLIKEAMSLPIEDRTMLIDSLIKSLNTTKSDVEDKWISIAKKRLTEIKASKIKPVPGNIVFNNILERFNK